MWNVGASGEALCGMLGHQEKCGMLGIRRSVVCLAPGEEKKASRKWPKVKNNNKPT